MSDSNERPPAEVTPPAPSLTPVPPVGHGASSRPEAKPDAQQSNHGAGSNHDLTVELKRRLEDTRLPSNLKEQILAELPSPEEQERLYRELREKGGLSFEQFLDSLGRDVEPQP